MKTYTILAASIALQTLELNAQCPFDFMLDEYLYVCNEQQLPMNLGESMILEPALEPYTFYWDCFYEPFPGSELTFDEFDFLDDPTEQFPYLLGSFDGDTLLFILTVTDNFGIQCTDSISVITSCWNIIMEGCDLFYIASGESVTLCSTHIPCIEPATYQWTPTDYLDDPTSPSPIASPPTDMTYCVEITDAIGCQANTCVDVNVGVTVVEQSKRNVQLFPNPTNEMLILQSQSAISLIDISDPFGRIVFSSQPNATQAKLNLESLSKGCYFLSATTENGAAETLKFLKD